MTTQLAELNTQLQTIYNKILDFSDVKDMILEDGNVELLGDAVSIIKTLKKSGELYNIIKFKLFLKGLDHNTATPTQLNQLSTYINNEKKSDFIASTFKKIIVSNSKLSCFIMGLYFSDITHKNRDITQKDLLLFTALENMNDFDITNFKYLFEYQSQQSYSYINFRTLKESAKKDHMNYTGLLLTIDTCEKYGLITKEGDVSIDIDEDDVSSASADYSEDYIFASLATDLYEMVKHIDSII